jgi:hypothetical protein
LTLTNASMNVGSLTAGTEGPAFWHYLIAI